MASSGSAMYLFPSDLVDEGVDVVLAALDRLGCRPAVAVAYHQARDVLPHAGHKPRLRFRRDGVFFEEKEGWPSPELTPPVQSAEENRSVAELRAAADGSAPEAWTVFLHNTTLGERLPSAVAHTCFGDPLYANLCPSHAAVRAYALRLATAVAGRGFDVIAEALSGQTFAHGHHHERSFTPLGEGEQVMLAVCFCDACRLLGEGADVDVDGLRYGLQDHLQRAFSSEAGIPATRDALAGAVGEPVLRYLDAGTTAVTSLAADVASAVRGTGRRLSFMDLTGAVLGYDDGVPSGPDAAKQAWRLRIDPAAIAPSVDSYSVLGYVRDAGRLHDDVASYRTATGETPLRVILRPGFPDARTQDDLIAHVDAARSAGADQVDFYNYGMYDRKILERILSTCR
ncbi:hypothetical protein ABC304_04670 [Microbacterium sp. 1P10UB]|uniref:hypothetical protein n=1 Tax=unclassified Microbacterium TaxID=2609290 RepID=UPI00399FE0FC